MSGAIAFNSPIKINLEEKNVSNAFKAHKSLKEDNSRNSDKECENISPDWFIVFSISFGKPFYFWI